MNAWPAITTDGVRVRLSPRIGRSLALSRPWSASTPVVGVLGGVMVRGRQQLDDRPGQSRRLIRGHLRRFAVGTDRQREEPRGRLHIAFGGDHHVDDLPVVVDGAVHLPPGAGHLHVGLIYEPAVPDGVAAWPGSVDDQWGEALHPPVQGDVVNLDAALS